jgi:hypothetical protein
MPVAPAFISSNGDVGVLTSVELGNHGKTPVDTQKLSGTQR